MEIGSKLKKARNKKGITQEQAAEVLGVSRQTISNWENSKSYPDIISVIKMSDVYSVSLDHLLKEDESMKQTYQEFLEESTNTVKAKNNLSKTIVIIAYLVVWNFSLLLLLNITGSMMDTLSIALRWVIFPSSLFAVTVVVARKGFFGKGKWLCVIIAALIFLAIPPSEVLVWYNEDVLTDISLKFPRITYMMVGILIAICGLGIGTSWRKSLLKKEGNDQ